MFNARLLELESELLAKEECARGLSELPHECWLLLERVEQEIGIKLASNVPKDWKGWLTYRRKDASDSQGSHTNCGLIVIRGRAGADGGIFAKWRAGLDVPMASESISEYKRGFDVSPPQDLDHLLINFGHAKTTRVFLWYGENFAPYRLIFEWDLAEDPEVPLIEAITEACVWIVKRPRDLTLSEYLKTLNT